MDDDKVNIQNALSVFNIVTTQGERNGEEYHYNGLIAKTDFDGYTVILKNNYASLTIYFHNKFSFEYTSQKEKLVFLNKIDEMHTAYKNKS